MEKKKVTVLVNIAKEEDRAVVAAILFKNGYPVAPVKDYKRKADGTKSTAVQYSVAIKDAEVTEWQ